MLKNKCLVLLLLAVSSPALADISYNYIDLGAQWVEIDDVAGIDVDGDGFGIGGSFEIGEDWFVQLAYGQADFDFDIELDQWALGFGYHRAMTENNDVFATLSYVSAEVSASGLGSADDDGFGIAVGVRSMLSDSFELTGALAYVDLDDGGDSTSLGLEGLYSFNDVFALGLGFEFDDDVTTYGVFGRFYFGN